MKGTIRIVLGFILMVGGVGGIETNMTETLPLDSLTWAIVGLLLMGWGVLATKEQEA